MSGRLLLTGSLVVVAMACAACNPTTPESKHAVSQPSARASAALPPLHFTGHGTARHPIRIVQLDGKRTLYELLAHRLTGSESAKATISYLDDVQITFFARNGSQLRAKAPHATVDEGAGTLTLLGGVHARTATGLLLQCDTLRYSRGANALHGEGHVVMTDPQGLRATGTRFDSDLSFTNVRMR